MTQGVMGRVREAARSKRGTMAMGKGPEKLYGKYLKKEEKFVVMEKSE